MLGPIVELQLVVVQQRYAMFISMEVAPSVEPSLIEDHGKPISIRKQTDIRKQTNLYRHARRHPCSKSNLQLSWKILHLFFFTASLPI